MGEFTCWIKLESKTNFQKVLELNDAAVKVDQSISVKLKLPT